MAQQKPRTRTNRRYSDEEKAQALATLDINGGNVKGTARQLGLPHDTLRTWADKYNRIQRGELATSRAINLDVLKMKDEGLGEYLEKAEVVRDAALDKLKLLIPQATAGNIAALTNLTIALSDKIDRAKGVVDKHTIVEHKHSVDPSEWAEVLTTYASKARLDAITRSAAIITVEAEEQPEYMGLPSAEEDTE